MAKIKQANLETNDYNLPPTPAPPRPTSTTFSNRIKKLDKSKTQHSIEIEKKSKNNGNIKYIMAYNPRNG